MRIFFALIFLIFATTGKAADSVVADLKKELREGLQKVSAANTKLASQYLEALATLRNEAVENFETERAEAINREMGLFSVAGERDYSAFPKLKKLRDFYEKNAEPMEKNLRKSRHATLQIYRDRFAGLEKSLAAEGETAEAVEAKRHLKKIDAALDDEANLRALLAIWAMEKVTDVKIEKEAKVERKGGAFQISSKHRTGSWVESTVAVKPPFQISMRAKTDSTNLRIYYGRRVMTIFNWEVRPTELRVHDPTPGVKANYPVPDQGYLDVDEMHHIRIFVLADRIHIVADNEQRFVMQGDFSNLSGGIGVGPAFGSTVSIERFEILPLFAP